jgi:hypothetical protein
MTSPFLLLTTVQLSRAEKITEYLPFKRVEQSSESTVMGPNFHQKYKNWKIPYTKFLFLVEIQYF